MVDLATAGGLETIEKREDIYKDARTVVSYWLNAIKLSEKQEEDWKKKAEQAVKIYRAEDNPAFNILHSNVETIVPALYNSTPVPDVRNRHQDKNELSRKGAQLIERGVSFQLDEYGFDANIVASVRDMQIAGRGLDRVRYRPYTRTETAKDPATGEEVETEEVVWEEATCEHISWRSFRRGPGSMWAEIPWVAFELLLTRDELIDLAGEEIGGKVPLDHSENNIAQLATERERSAFKRAKVFEIWDRDSRQVLFIAANWDEKPLRVEPDPLGLLDFYPVPCPLQAISDPDTMVPVVPYEIYRKQAEELADVSQRILGLIGVMRFRGFKAPEIPDFDALESLEDGEFASTSQAISLLGGAGKLDDYIWTVPVDKLVTVLRELVVQREAIKGAIFEITGIADIMRGASNPNETLGAQQIKTQWGSLRVQHQQREVQRYCRDLFRMKAEIIANKFSVQTLEMIQGEPFVTMIPDPSAPVPQPQMPAMGGPAGMAGGPAGTPPAPPPMIEDPNQSGENHPVVQLLRNDIRRTYLIDIETDSTIRGDLVRAQQNMTQFLQGTAQFFGSLVPLIQSGTFPPQLMQAAIVVYDAFQRQFKLGKPVEDAFAELTKQAEQMAKQPPTPKPDPKKQELELAREDYAARLKMDQEDTALRRDADIAHEGKKLDMQMAAKAQAPVQEADPNAPTEREKFEFERSLKERELRLKTAAQNKQIVTEAEEELGEGQPTEVAKSPLADLGQAITMLAASMADSNRQLAEQIAQGQAQQSEQFNQLAQLIAAPRIVDLKRGRDGKATGATSSIALN